ncbi:tetratricopeptide repeat protein [Marinobacterium rhizophilum]|uniref:Tetratricopeptide repeat protein n=1 Tax=Marinobacterium rhizophilum TaxID=420402 RepID=A0ABY5HLC5_9GAMM|nr:hypothetical protein [Marinobacterium rhizophilum]UTW12047.1 hypothetical protein KDW95_22960 [Marinobacterium rhizophilum]
MPSAFKRISVSLLVLVLLGGCASDMDRRRSEQPDPNVRLDQMLGLYHQSVASGSACAEIWHADSGTIDCERILREVERLQVEFPWHERITMSNAVMNYQTGRADKAQFLLDQLLARRGSRPEAAILRARIAMEEGNSRLARELLLREIQLSPTYAELREALAAAAYLDGEYDDAESALAIAGRLGAPQWRLDYHRGLLKESRGHWQQACRLYRSALGLKPDFKAAMGRLIDLSQQPACVQLGRLPIVPRKRVH